MLLSLEHPEIFPILAQLEVGLLPVREEPNGPLLLVIKLVKEGILAAKLDKGFAFYVPPVDLELGVRPGIITAFFDDQDEPLTIKSPLFAGDQQTVLLLELLGQAEFDVHIVDDHNREMLAYRCVNAGAGRARSELKDASFAPLVIQLAGRLHQSLDSWFGDRDESANEQAFRIDFAEPLLPDDIFVMDLRPQEGNFRGGSGYSSTILEREHPGPWQEADIAGLLQRPFNDKEIFLNPVRADNGKEFTDLFVSSESNRIILHAKDSPNTAASLNRSIARKKAAATKHLETAVRQMRGSIAHYRSADPLKLVVQGQAVDIHTGALQLRGIIVLQEMFNTEHVIYSRPVLSLTRETGVRCIVLDYAQLHAITLNRSSEVEFTRCFDEIFEFAQQHGQFPRSRFGLIE